MDADLFMGTAVFVMARHLSMERMASSRSSKQDPAATREAVAAVDAWLDGQGETPGRALLADATRRTRLANERTFLAWLRGGLTSIAVGVGAFFFAVAASVYDL